MMSVGVLEHEVGERFEAIVTQQPASKTYSVMTAVAYYAGLRPSEVVMLRVRSTELPVNGEMPNAQSDSPTGRSNLGEIIRRMRPHRDSITVGVVDGTG